MENENPIVFSYCGVQMREDDVALLHGPFCLNDQIIEFHQKFLETHLFQAHPEKFLFVSPAVTQLIKIGSDGVNTFLDPLEVAQKSVLFFPVNNEQRTREGTHWSLLVYSRNEETFFSFDSSQGSNLNRSSTNQLVKVLKRAFGCAGAKLVHHSCHQQSNNYDCGIFILAYTEKICHHFIKTRAVRDVPLLRPGVTKKRLELLSIIHQLRGLSEQQGHETV